MPRKLFIYGTLREPAVQRELWQRVVEGVPDALRDHERVAVTLLGKTYPDLAVSSGSEVEGVVVELTDEELKSADDYETAAYERREMVLASGAAADVYISKKP